MIWFLSIYFLALAYNFRKMDVMRPGRVLPNEKNKENLLLGLKRLQDPNVK